MICREVLEGQGRSNTWLAGVLSVTQSHVSRLMSGERKWSARAQHVTALALSVPESVLFADLDADGYGPKVARKLEPAWDAVGRAGVL